jgi:plastocyanin
MFAKKCPKCGGKVQTKVIKKTIGLGNVDIPVSQFCLNHSCDWYQDFAEAKKPEEVKENVLHIELPSVNKLPEIKKPAITSNHVIVLAGVVVVVLVLLIILQAPGLQTGKTPLATQTPVSTAINPEIDNTPAHVSVIVTSTSPSTEPETYSVRIDVANGFIPKEVTINRSDIVQWNDQENQRPRIVLISNDKLFEGKIMRYPDRFSYQFNKSGNYIFVLEEYPSLNIYPNATGRVIVK